MPLPVDTPANPHIPPATALGRPIIRLSASTESKYIKQTAIAVGNLAEQIYKYKSQNVVLVSIVRSGIPIGILVKRYSVY